MSEVVRDEAKKANTVDGTTNLVEDVTTKPKQAAADTEEESDTAADFDSEDSDYGSLEDDKAVETHKISDDDERWEQLDPSGGLKKLVLKVGHGDSPSEGEKVSCHYSGFLRSNGEMFDSSRERGDIFKFDIGKGSVIKGWDKGIATMKIGERAILRCTSEFAYGEKGSEPKIPPNATLDFVVYLKGVQQYEPLWDIDDAKDSITKKTMTESDEWETAKKLWTLTVTYTGREKDEKGRIWCSGTDEKIKIPYDSEFESNGFIPEYDHPRGFYVCLKNTKKGEQNYFKLQATEFYTFGSGGSTKFNIAANTDLFYDITVTDMEKFKMSSWEMDDGEKIPKAKELKDLANDFFKRKKLSVAKEVYKDVLEITTNMKDDDDDKKCKDEEANAISVACHSNTALIETQLNNLSEASESIEKGLAIDPKHMKLRYRQAQLHFKLGEFSLAGTVLAELKKEFPENKGVKVLSVKNSRASKEAKKKARMLAKKMFGPEAAKKLREKDERAAAQKKAEDENAKDASDDSDEDDAAVKNAEKSDGEVVSKDENAEASNDGAAADSNEKKGIDSSEIDLEVEE